MVFRNPLARSHDAQKSSTSSVSKDLAFKILNEDESEKNTKSHKKILKIKL